MKKKFHSLLDRQIKRNFGERFSIPEKWRDFIDEIDRAYHEFDTGRAMLERAFDLSSTEILELNTEIREERDKVLKREALLNEVGEMAKVGGWEFDLETNELYGTSESYKIIEIPEEKIDLERTLRFFDEPDRSKLEAAINRCMESGEPYDLKLPLTTATGKHLWTRVMGRAVRVNDKIVKLTGTFQDITDIKNVEIKLEHNQQELSEWSKVLERRVEARTAELAAVQARLVEHERLAVLGQISASISHELRTPLTGIKNAVYLMQMLGVEKQDPKIAENFALINMEVNACIRVLNNMLDFVRPKAPILKEARLDVIVNNTISAMVVPANVEISKQMQENLPSLMLDALQIQQVFDNIIKNAFEAMSSGGGKLTVTAKVEEGYVVVRFADTGVGIARDSLPKIFDPLYSTTPTGVGLGLTIARQLIEAHGGAIGVESQLGKGTILTVRIPIK